MSEIIHLFLHSQLTIIVTILLSILSCVLGIRFSRDLKQKGYTHRRNAAFSVILALTFWLTHIFISFSTKLPVSDQQISYFVINYFFCFIGAFYALKTAQTQLSSIKEYILTSLVVCLSILGADYVGFYYLFHDYINVSPLLILMTAGLSFGSSLSILRFLSQITNEDSYSTFNRWAFIGQAAAGIALAGIPYIVMVSFLTFDNSVMPEDNQLFFLVPFLFVIIANVVLMLVPDLFSENLLAKKSQSHLSLFNHNPDSVFWVDLDGTILDTNHVSTRLTGYTKQELAGMHFNDLLEVKMKSDRVKKYFKSVLKGETNVVDSRAVRKDGTLVDVRITAVRIILRDETIGAYGIVKDITQEKQAAALIKEMAYSDDLTGLPNKRKLEQVIEKLIDLNIPFAVLYIDFDRFKRINDTFGHFFGDKVIQEIACKIKKAIGSQHTIARMGGDEFSVILRDEKKILPLAEKIIDEFNRPLKIDGYEFLITASIGVSRYPDDADNLVSLLRNADIAMYEAKQNGANMYKEFKEEMFGDKLNKLELENDLRHAINNHEIEVYYQPKYNSLSDELIGSEALARWKHPKYGWISPGTFIPIAEEAHLIVQLERAVMLKVFKTVSRWKSAGFKVPRTSINVSVIHFYQEDLIDFIKHSLEHFGISGKDLELEVTESIMVKSESSINRDLQELRNIGIEISIDDFGTGYSSLHYLQHLSIDRLKIDKSFIANSSTNHEIVSTIVAMAKSLKLSVIAEGVETKDQLDLLRKNGCVEVQGFFYSPPVEKNHYQLMMNSAEESLV